MRRKLLEPAGLTAAEEAETEAEHRQSLERDAVERMGGDLSASPADLAAKKLAARRHVTWERLRSLTGGETADEIIEFWERTVEATELMGVARERSAAKRDQLMAQLDALEAGFKRMRQRAEAEQRAPNESREFVAVDQDYWAASRRLENARDRYTVAAALQTRCLSTSTAKASGWGRRAHGADASREPQQHPQAANVPRYPHAPARGDRLAAARSLSL